MGTYSDRLKEAMQDKGMTVSELAKEMKVTYQAVSKAEKGKSHGFSAENNSVAANILGVSADWLARGKGQKKSVLSDLNAIISASLLSMKSHSDQAQDERAKLSAEAVMVGRMIDQITDYTAKTEAIREALTVVRDHYRNFLEAGRNSYHLQLPPPQKGRPHPSRKP